MLVSLIPFVPWNMSLFIIPALCSSRNIYSHLLRILADYSAGFYSGATKVCDFLDRSPGVAHILVSCHNQVNSCMRFGKTVLEIVLGGVAAAVFFLPVESNASGILYQFDTPFPADASPAGSSPWINASFQDVSGGVLLTVNNLGLTSSEFLQGNGSGANGGIFFNLNPNDNPTSLTFSLVSQSANFGTYINTGENAFKADGDGKYDIVFDFTTHSFAGGASFSYLISGIAGLTASDFAYLSAPAGGSGPFYAAAHIMGLPPDASNSTWIEPGNGPASLLPVPEPSSFALIAGSFGLWGLTCRWHKRRI
jgi:hypothetical protein